MFNPSRTATSVPITSVNEREFLNGVVASLLLEGVCTLEVVHSVITFHLTNNSINKLKPNSLRTVSTDGITPQTQDFIFGSSWAGSWSCLSWCPWALKNLQALKPCHERSSEDTFWSRWWVSQVLMISKLRLPLLPTKACWATAAKPWITWVFYCRGCKIQPDQQTWSQCTD